jgi:hypothetical protein
MLNPKKYARELKCGASIEIMDYRTVSNCISIRVQNAGQTTYITDGSQCLSVGETGKLTITLHKDSLSALRSLLDEIEPPAPAPEPVWTSLGPAFLQQTYWQWLRSLFA